MQSYNKPLLQLSILTILLIVITFFIGVSITNAQDIIQGNNIPAGTTIDNEAILIDDTVTIDGIINGDVLAVGSNVNINGSINGSLIVLGDTVRIDGDINGTVYAAALNLELNESAAVDRNLYFVGLSLITREGSSIGRDLYTFTLGATLGGSIDRNTNAVIGPIEIIKLIMGLVENIQGQSQFLPPSTNSVSLSSFNQSIFYSSMDDSQNPEVNTNSSYRFITYQNNINHTHLLQTSTASTGIDVDRLQHWIIVRLREFLTLLVFGLIAMWIFPTLYSSSMETIQSKALPSFGWGLLLLVIAFNIIALSFLLAALIFMVGLFLGTITLWSLAFAFWTIGISGLGLVTTLFILFVIYVSKTIVVYLVARLALDPLIPNLSRYKIIPLIIGLIVFVLLHSISILGAVISILVTAFGLGITWITWRKIRTQRIQDNKLTSHDALDPTD